MSEENDESPEIKRAEKPGFLTSKRFEDFNLPSKVLAGLNENGFEYCTPIQAQVLPVSLTGKDVAGQAQTGTGKTMAFLLTVFARLLDEKREGKAPSALIVAPTRELALQIHEDATLAGKYTGLTITQVVGGIDYKKQADELRGGTDIVICTPGRVIDYLRQGILDTSNIKIVVIDEADRLFDLGFTKDMRYILRKLPHYEKRQSLLFSATLSHRVLELTYDYMNLPEFISVIPDNSFVENIDQMMFHVGSDEKLPLLLGLLKIREWTSMLIFANTKADVEYLAKKLKGNGYPAEAITGDLPQQQRMKLMERFKGGKTKILVATDVASRGIHVEDISHVINYDLPQDPENYTHRIGRTARAGKSGQAISFACETYVYYLEPIETMLGRPIPVVWADDEWFVKDKAGAVTSRQRSDKKKSAPKKKKPELSNQPVYDYQLRNIGMSSEPGGIFGLVPDKTQKEDPVPAVKKRKRKPKRKKSSLSNDSNNEGVETEKPGTVEKTDEPEKKAQGEAEGI